MFIGFTGAAFNKDATVEVKMGDKFTLGGYEMRVREVKQGDNTNYSWGHTVVDVHVGGNLVKTMAPEQRLYKADRQPASVVSIWRRLNEDVYLNFAGMNNDGNKAVIQAYVFPLVSWIWIGFWVLLVGNIICLIPSKVKLQFARTEVIGMVATKQDVRSYAIVSALFWRRCAWARFRVSWSRPKSAASAAGWRVCAGRARTRWETAPCWRAITRSRRVSVSKRCRSRARPTMPSSASS